MTSQLPKRDPADLPSAPEAPDGVGVDTLNEKRIRELIEEGLASGPAVPADEAFFERLRRRVPTRD
jgi:hypothetical protein